MTATTPEPDVSGPVAREGEASRPLRLLVGAFQSGRGADGGVESITQVLARLPRTRLSVVTQLETPLTERWRVLGFDVHVWPVPHALGAPLAAGPVARLRALLDLNRRTRALVRAESIEVVHCNDPSALWYLGPGARAAGVPVVYNIRDTKPLGDRYGWAKLRLGAALSTRQLVISEEMQGLFGRHLAVPGLVRPRVESIYSVVDFERMRVPSPTERAERRDTLGIPPETLALAYVAAVVPKKGQLAFIREALPQIAARLPDAHVYFVGDADPATQYARDCREALAASGLASRATFVGFVPRVEAWYQAADLLLLASQKEGLARCMAEGQACGVPMVSYDVCSAREILDGHASGTVISQGDTSAFVDAVVAFGSDPELRAAAGRRAADGARQVFDSARVVSQYEQLYRSVAHLA